MATLKSVKIKDKNYSYIQYADGTVSTPGFIASIENKEKFENIGGYYRDILEPAIVEDIDKIIVLSITSKAMSILTSVFFVKDGQVIKQNNSIQPNFCDFLMKKMNQLNVSFEQINTLEFLQSQENLENFGNILEFQTMPFYNPISTNDTGIYVGTEMVNYGDVLEFNLTKEFIEKFPTLKDSSFAAFDVDRISVKVNENGISPFLNAIGEAIMWSNGKEISTLEYYNKKYSPELSFEEYLLETQIEYAEYAAKNANEEISRKPEKKEKLIKEAAEYYEAKMNEEMSAYKESIGINLLFELINADLLVK